MARIEIPYSPRYHQRAIHKARVKNTVIVWHRRAGKTVMADNELIKSALLCPLKAPRFAYIAPQRNQAKAVAWDYLKHYSRVIPGVQFNEAELRADFPNGGRVTLYGADNPDAMRGLYLGGVVRDEVAQMPPRMMSEIITPALLDRNGWKILIGTPSGHNAFYEAYQLARAEMAAGNPDWYAGLLRASESGILPQEALDDARKQMTPEEYEQEFECSFEAAILGAYYGKELAAAEREGRICAVPVDPSYPVHTAWDFGLRDPTSVWFFQVTGQGVRFVDFFESPDLNVPQMRDLINDRGYWYGSHIGPHDMEHRTRTETTLVTLKKLMTFAGLDFIVADRSPLMAGIHAAKMMLPTCWFDSVKCKQGIETLKLYRQRQDPNTGTWSNIPVHDWTSHASDAFRYAAVMRDAVAGSGIRGGITPTLARTEWEQYAPPATW